MARYVTRFGEQRLRSVVFAAGVPPYLLTSDDNADGRMTQEAADAMLNQLKQDSEAFYDQFTTEFFSVDGTLSITEETTAAGVGVVPQADQRAALGWV